MVDSTPLKLAVFFLALPFGVLSPVLRTGNLGDDISSMKSKSDFSSVLNKETNAEMLIQCCENDDKLYMCVHMKQMVIHKQIRKIDFISVALRSLSSINP